MFKTRLIHNGLALFLAVAASLAARSAHALVFTVNTTSDTHDKTPGDNKCSDSSGKCSLRAAIEESNKLNTGPTVKLPAGRYNLNTAVGFGELYISASILLFGDSAVTSIIDAGGKSRVMRINSGQVIIKSVTLQNGNGWKDVSTPFSVQPASSPGGALFVDSKGFADVQSCVVTTTIAIAAPNLPFPGGGVAVMSGGTINLKDSTVSNNKTKIDLSGGTQHSGGGLFGYQGSHINISYSTITNNTSTRGGGVGLGGGSMNMTNSTVSENFSNVEGGAGIYVSGSGRVNVMYSTITNNTILNPGSDPTKQLFWGGGIRVYVGSLNIGKCIVSGNDDGRKSPNADYSPDIGQDSTSSIVSYDDNVIGIVGNHLGNYTGFDGDAFDWFGTAVFALGPLENIGGLTMVHPVLWGDPIDAYSGDGGSALFAAPPDDQTHYPRSDGWPDSGSFEN